VLWRCWLGGRKGIRPVKNWVVGCWRGYLSGGADLHTAQLIPLPLAVSCFSKIQIGFTFLVPVCVCKYLILLTISSHDFSRFFFVYVIVLLYCLGASLNPPHYGWEINPTSDTMKHASPSLDRTWRHDLGSYCLATIAAFRLTVWHLKWPIRQPPL